MWLRSFFVETGARSAFYMGSISGVLATCLGLEKPAKPLMTSPQFVASTQKKLEGY